MEDKIKIIEIDGVGFSFNANRAHERDGHVYCRQCGEQIDSEPLACLGGKTEPENCQVLCQSCNAKKSDNY